MRTTDPDNDSFLLQDVLSIVLVSPSSDQLYCVSIYRERDYDYCKGKWKTISGGGGSRDVIYWQAMIYSYLFQNWAHPHSNHMTISNVKCDKPNAINLSLGADMLTKTTHCWHHWEYIVYLCGLKRIIAGPATRYRVASYKIENTLVCDGKPMNTSFLLEQII